MKKAELCFKIELDYQTKAFKPLADMALFRAYSTKQKEYVWIFPMNKVKHVLALLGHPLNFSAEDIEVVKEFFNNIKKEQIKRGAIYGEGFVEVKFHPKLPNYFQVTTVRNRQPENTNVSFETVNALWRAIKKQPKDKKVMTPTTAKNYCMELGIIDFNVYERGEFNWKYFFGTRKYYLVFYAALKVLQHYGVAEHIRAASKSGIVRKSDSWSVQTELDTEE